MTDVNGSRAGPKASDCDRSPAWPVGPVTDEQMVPAGLAFGCRAAATGSAPVVALEQTRRPGAPPPGPRSGTHGLAPGAAAHGLTGRARRVLTPEGAVEHHYLFDVGLRRYRILSRLATRVGLIPWRTQASPGIRRDAGQRLPRPEAFERRDDPQGVRHQLAVIE